MSEHKKNPVAMAASQMAGARRGRGLGTRIEVTLQPKLKYVITTKERHRLNESGNAEVLDYDETWKPVPEGKEVLFDGEEVGPDKMDFVVALCATMTDSSIITPDGKIPQNTVILSELFRGDWASVMQALGQDFQAKE